MSILRACVYVHGVCQALHELPYGHAELSPGPLEKQQMLLTASHLFSSCITECVYVCVRACTLRCSCERVEVTAQLTGLSSVLSL